MKKFYTNSILFVSTLVFSKMKDFRSFFVFTNLFIKMIMIFALFFLWTGNAIAQTTSSGLAYTWTTPISWTPNSVPASSSTVTVDNPLTLDQDLTIGTGNYTFNQDVTDQPGGSNYNLTNSNASGSLTIASGTTTIGGITSIGGNATFTLTVKSGATLVLGTPGSISNNFLIGNKSNITIEQGATIIVYGNILNSNSTGAFTVNGLLQVYGDYITDNGNIDISGTTGQFYTTGAMTTQGNSSQIYGSSNNCTSNCSGTSLGCGTSNPDIAYTATITEQSQTVCSGGSASKLTFTTNAPSPTYQWESSLTAGGTYSNVLGATTTTTAFYTPTGLTVTTWYRVKYTSSASGCETKYSAPVPVYVSASTYTQSTAAQTVCGGSFGPISVSANGTALTYQWYSNTSASNSGGASISLATSNIYTPPSDIAGTKYYYCIINSSCGTPYRTVVSGAFTVNLNSAGIASSTPTLCISTALTNITHTTTGATGIGTATGLPAGVTAVFGSNTITISGTPTASGTFNYSIPLTGGCGTVNATGTIMVSEPVAQTVTGTNTVCIGSTTTFSSTTSGGTWTSATPAVATVNSSTGVVTGVTAGTSIINYSVTTAGGCVNIASQTVTVSAPVAQTVTGTNTVCIGSTTTFRSTTSGGTWTSATPAVATVNSSTGVVTGVTAGTSIINYSVTTAGGCVNIASQTVTVSAPIAQTVSGTNTVCIGSITTFSSTTSGGTWTSATPAAATVNASTGVVTGVSAGTSIINYSVTTAGGCVNTASRTVTVNALPNNVTDGFSASIICAGESPRLTFNADDTTFSAGYIITYKNNNAVKEYTQAISTATPYSFTPGDNPTTNAGYTLVSISNSTCTRTNGFIHPEARLTVRPMPIATIKGTTSLCVEAVPTNITFTNPQTVAITVTYTINDGGLQTVDIIAGSGTVSGIINVPVVTSAAGVFVYELVGVSYKSPSNCPNPISGSVTVTINPNLPASVSIAASTNPICSGTAVTFTATPTNGGTAPTYQWYNGATLIIGATSSTYTSTSLVNGDAIKVIMTSNATCATGSPATSNTVSMTVNPNLTASVIVAVSPMGAICAGTSVIFTATPTNGGTAPTYQWYTGATLIIGATSSTYTSTSLVNGDAIKVIMTSNATCATSSPATSNTFTMTVNPNLPASVIVAVSTNPICSGIAVTFTATPTNGGTAPTYQWYNGATLINGETASTYATNSLVNGDAIKVIMTSNGTCATGNPVSSTPVIMTVNPNLPASVIVAVSTNPICSGTSVTFTATPTNGGTAPTYQWYNGATLINGETASTYATNSLVNGDAIKVIMTSNATCATGNPVSSTPVIMTVNPNLPASVIVAVSTNPICSGTAVTFIATPTNGGTAPTYQWYNGATLINGETASTYATNSLVNGDAIKVIMTSNATCATGNPATSIPVTMTVNTNLPASVSVAVSPTGSICAGTAVTFIATPTNEGAAPTYQWYNGATLINGETSSTYATNSLVNGDAIKVIMTSNATCATGNPATSIPITMTVNTNLPVSVSVAVSPTGAICAGTLVTFTATPTNEGAAPTYQWYNGATLINGESAATYATNSLVNGDAIKVIMTSNTTCAMGNPATSNSVAMTVPAAAIWTGSWTNGPPTYAQAVIFNGTYTSDGNMEACSCQVNSGAVTIKSGHTLKITNGVTVSMGGTLTFENNSSLVQINDVAANSGSISYKRETTPILDTDYVYWSSPVTGAILGAIQTATLYYSFNAAGNSWVKAFGNTQMLNGIGYIVRGAGTGLASGPRLARTATFIGLPNNGINDVNITASRSNLIGNPYPSAIDADAFLNANKAALEGTLYFWTHKSEIKLAGSITVGTAGSGAYAYTSGDYAAYTLTGGVGTSLTGGVASSKIAAGQSFMALGSSQGGTARFTNSMRLTKGGEVLDNSQFLRSASGSKTSKVTTTNEIVKSRIWLNLSNTQAAFKQTLIGYVNGATNHYDRGFDAVTINGNAYVDFYSINNDSLLTIQGRALPIPEADTVPLGFSSAIEGDFTISIDKTDGLLTAMDVFLEDKLSKTFTNLKSSTYTFSSRKGTFNDRFVLSYANKALEVTDFETTLENQVVVANKSKQLIITSTADAIDKVVIFDTTSRKVYEKRNVDSQELRILDLMSSRQILLVKVVLQNGKSITKKVIY